MEEFAHRIERTRNRHSRAVVQDGIVVIRLARGLSFREEKDHIAELLRRMARSLVRERQKTLIDPFRLLLSEGQGNIVLANGKTYAVRLLPGTKTSIEETPGGWEIRVGPRIGKRQLHALLWKILSAREKSWLADFVEEVNASTFRARVRNVRLRFASSQWGSCSPHGTITINTTLLFVPEAALTYLVIHELAHRLHPNHSLRFWNAVKSVLPEYERGKSLLSKFRLPKM